MGFKPNSGISSLAPVFPGRFSYFIQMIPRSRWFRVFKLWLKMQLLILR